MENTQTENGTNINNQPFEFTGKALEYFSIWIVNVALTIITLGIYSAWAKVRTNQYFYGNTLLDGASFRYTAKPTQILKGRVIAFILFVLYYFASMANPVVAGIIFLFILLLVPAFVVMSMAFRLRNSMYRNVRFNFDKKFARAYKVFFIPVIFIGAYLFVASQIEHLQSADTETSTMLGIVIIVLLLGIILMVPWWEYIVTRFKVTHAKYGKAEFSFSARMKNYYGMYLKAYLLSILIFGVIGALIAGMMKSMTSDAGSMASTIIIALLIFPAYLWLFAYFQTKRTNLIYGNLKIDGHKVKSELKTGYMLYLYVTNTLAIMLTLGLLMPWAKIRTAKYRVSVTSIDVVGDLSQFVAAQEQYQSAMGEEIGEMFDLDLGF
ncbi:Thymidylate kinase [hydrothermal vent metagenome]|uniref:Thymidylate kinase n=1 Tax=hydrothermal vent metagenome TaxID=652676 RepID=A0A3B1A8J9_9ZZZZ